MSPSMEYTDVFIAQVSNCTRCVKHRKLAMPDDTVDTVVCLSSSWDGGPARIPYAAAESAVLLSQQCC